MNELRLTGGARIGMANATFPFATLKVNKEHLELNASILGNLSFQPSDVISIEPYTLIPILGQGIKINHKVPTYKERVIFWAFKDPIAIIKQIHDIGFLNNENAPTQVIDNTIREKQAKGSFPLKRWFVIAIFVVWNTFFLIDFIPFFFGEGRNPIGNGMKIAVGILFLTALSSLISADFRNLILKEGRELEDIKKFAIFIMIISGFMFMNLVLFSMVI